MMQEIRQSFGLVLLFTLIFLVMMLIEFRKRRLNSEYQMNFNNSLAVILILIALLATPFIIVYPIQALRDFLRSNLESATYFIISVLLTIGVFILLRTIVWWLKFFLLLDPDGKLPSIQVQRTRSYFIPSMLSYLFFSGIYYNEEDPRFMVGMTLIFFVFLTYEWRNKQRMEMLKNQSHCDELKE